MKGKFVHFASWAREHCVCPVEFLRYCPEAFKEGVICSANFHILLSFKTPTVYFCFCMSEFSYVLVLCTQNDIDVTLENCSLAVARSLPVCASTELRAFGLLLSDHIHQHSFWSFAGFPSQSIYCSLPLCVFYCILFIFTPSPPYSDCLIPIKLRMPFTKYIQTHTHTSPLLYPNFTSSSTPPLPLSPPPPAAPATAAASSSSSSKFSLL